MGLRIDKVKNELADAWQQAIVENVRETLRDPKRFWHCYTDIWVEGIRALPYTLGHIVAVVILVAAFISLGHWLMDNL